MALLESILEQYKLIVTLIVVLLFPFLVKLQKKLLANTVKGRIDPHRQHRAELLLTSILAIVLLCLVLVFWGIELRGLLVLGSSLFAMLGVALFAAWSLLSNLTSFLLMFIQNDCRVGYWVRVIDGANFVEGKVVEMGLLNVILETSDGHRVLYPNNLFVVRPVMILNRSLREKKKLYSTRLIELKKRNTR
ncbi:mechanosensitive ion channel domain-containing protein [Pseudoalteromonas tunicata]|uniref:Small-conductance mechanosensitive channel n=1 Tax=Pseudoalteromonas tunicata D2 TaxID=87626 RepID=A4C715_9GAMM|nr:mechanosensitive ion channel domain-containing protein [Pseudoalteromonas tunicata]ATC95738.1 hypothetical protein PTUN_a3401 [Pseudoalteromonas tunicata]AXT31293.1 mechanosensitive ion channel family protein [Pseudoalteromonas tunicata]EAR29769.1 hypothetical protein PTD2_13154 [Pseudoalteromonas tunicata D2]MDP4985674.1 mechanosensitive ion channel family protein [Pseudoalteromonas tunicata]MDP5214005.1 mechanosensitive ion channel [Pseudoalteromonas tunicata]